VICLQRRQIDRARQLIESRVCGHRHVRGGVARVDHRAAIALDHRDGPPSRGREVGRGQSGDTAPMMTTSMVRSRSSFGNDRKEAESAQYGKVPACEMERCDMAMLNEANGRPR